MKIRISFALLSLLVIFQNLSGQNAPVNRANFRLQALKTDQPVTPGREVLARLKNLIGEESWRIEEITFQ